MSIPVFIHVLSTGDIWYSNDVNFVPKGTILGSYRVNSDAATQKIGTLTASASAVTATSNSTGRFGKEIV